jgi:signal transduction histidine kinase
MSLAQFRTRPKWIIGLSCLLIVAATLGWFEVRRPKLEQRIYSIGFDNDPPQHFVGKDGKLTGIIVELIDEAARRRGIRLQWRLEPESSESALKSKKVDLWPLITIRPERKGIVYITNPYREDENCFLVRSGSTATRLEDLRNSTIAYDGSPLNVRLLHLRLPNAHISVITSPKERLEAVCRQHVEAAYFDQYAALATLLDGVACGDQGLRVIQVPEMNGLLGVGSTFEARPAADVIRAEIGDMAADGTLEKIASRWRFFSSQNLEVANELARVQTRERWLIAGISGAILLLLVTLWQAATIRRALASAREATKLKSEFLANMSHEIRTPMNAILGMAALAKDTPDHGEQQEYLDDVITSGESLLALLNDILDLSRIEAGKLALELADFDPDDVARGVCSLLAGGGRRKGLELTCKVPTPPPGQVQGDQVRLRQALVNLVGNAIKFTERGRVDLEVEVEGESDHLVTIRFTVKDTGIGISKEAQRRIFESFVQADGSVTRKYGGSGLGLSISRELIAKMGGELRVESALGQGSTFWFVLPFEKAHEMSSGAADQCLSIESEQLVKSRMP